MLKELYIKNYALIDELTMPFSKNLTVLSGETGAGKSIIVDALSLILGDKARTSSIRSGMESCIVEGRFEIEKEHPVYELLERKGIDCYDDEDVIVRRIITSSGGSKSYINGLQVPAKVLQEVTDILIDIHGQHEHQSLLNIKNHIYLLDQYGKLQDELTAYQKCYRTMKSLREEIIRCTIDEREKERRIDILKYSINEIDQAAVSEGEDEELEQEYKILRNYEKLVSSINTAYNYLQLHESSALSMIEGALTELTEIKDVSSDIEMLFSELSTAKTVMEDSAYSLKHYVDTIEYEPGKIDRILSRLELIKGMKKKYGNTVKEINEYGQTCETELETLKSNEALLHDLHNKLENEIRKAQKYAVELSARRRVAARTLTESVVKELSYLSMGKARFSVHITYKEVEKGLVTLDGKKYELSITGLDSVEFLISTNIGEPLMPLRRVASGGELSRIMLAIKTVLGNIDPIQTFVFDEIDAGIGGKVAWAVGNRLRDMASLKQILCITHQAQIASKGNLNIRVDKMNKEGRTVAEIKMLGGREKIEEIARMISGKTISEAALRQADEMIKENT